MNNSNKRVTNPDTLPLILTPSDIADVMKLSRNKTYEIIHSESFPAFRVGKQYRVYREHFLAWLENRNSDKQVA